VPGERPVTAREFDTTDRLLYPVTKEVNAASVATSIVYDVAPLMAVQFAVKLFCVIEVAAFAVGAAAIVITVIVEEFPEVPPPFVERIR